MEQMKSRPHFYQFLFALLLMFMIPPTNVYGEFKKTKIAVLDFALRGDNFKTKDLGGIVAEWFTTTLVKDGRFEVVERALLQKIIQEQKLGMTGLIDKKSSAELGKILGVKTIITGSILQLQDIIDVNARIINVKSGSIVAAENIRSESTANLKSVIEKLTTQIMKNFPLTGYIVKRYDERVLIDLGMASGLQIGMDFIVFKEGEVIKHPKTGEVLEVEQIKTGVIQIQDIRPNVATAKILQENQGQQIKYGQLVQSIRKKQSKRETTLSSSGKKVQPESPGVSDKSTKAPSFSLTTQPYTRKDHVEGEQRDTLMSGGQGPPFKKVATGSYLMGSNRYSEKPQHYVKINREFFLTISEITFDDYDKFCVETNRPFPNNSGWGRGDRPVINVSWHDAQAYAKWLTEQTGITYRLPSESEWEWAAGSGTNTLYNWGNRFKINMANCKKCSKTEPSNRTTPVRNFPPNQFGFHDMSGNVWEWVQDCWVENYRNAPEDQSVRQVSGKCGNYTIRGGAWNSSKRHITTTARLGIWAGAKSNYIGFRLVRETESLALEPKQIERPTPEKEIAKKNVKKKARRKPVFDDDEDADEN